MPQGYDAAAQFCVQADTHLDQALEWADAAISAPFIGETSFNTLSVKAMVLSKMHKDDEAHKLMETALHLPGTTPIEIHQYGRQLLAAKKVDEAVMVFKYNAERNGDAWPVHVGLAGQGDRARKKLVEPRDREAGLYRMGRHGPCTTHREAAPDGQFPEGRNP